MELLNRLDDTELDKIEKPDISSSVRLGLVNLTDYLIRRGAELTPAIMMWASVSGNLEMINLLINNNCPIDSTAVSEAGTRGHINIINRLVEVEAPITDLAIIEIIEAGKLTRDNIERLRQLQL